jgi:glycosyltransferase involved in cell wall biosynthesis
MHSTVTMTAPHLGNGNGRAPALDISVVVPVRNAERVIGECLESIVRSGVKEIVVVDGLSTDGTVEIARRYPARILSDEGRGLPIARRLGVQAASSRWVALVDADVVLPDGALERLFDEFVEGGYTALQAGLHSVSGPRYWGQALVHHHRSGRSKDWFGVVATVFERDALLEHGFDERFVSGEDIELRWRLERQGARVGVSERTVVTHRFADDTFEFARDQWLMDGRGLGRMVRKHGWRAAWLFGLPLGAAIRGILLSLVRLQPRWIPYYLSYMVFNYVGMVGGLGVRSKGREGL